MVTRYKIYPVLPSLLTTISLATTGHPLTHTFPLRLKQHTSYHFASGACLQTTQANLSRNIAMMADLAKDDVEEVRLHDSSGGSYIHEAYFITYDQLVSDNSALRRGYVFVPKGISILIIWHSLDLVLITYRGRLRDSALVSLLIGGLLRSLGRIKPQNLN